MGTDRRFPRVARRVFMLVDRIGSGLYHLAEPMRENPQQSIYCETFADLGRKCDESKVKWTFNTFSSRSDDKINITYSLRFEELRGAQAVCFEHRIHDQKPAILTPSAPQILALKRDSH